VATAAWVVMLLAAGQVVSAATNDLTAALQRGLFEEEANHNLSAAIQAYESVITQFDRDRKLAATAIFRLGECYRKQGMTNQANAQYDRLLREFADQTTLAELSRQNRTALGGAQPAPGVLVAEAEAASLEAQLARFGKMSPEERWIVIQQEFPSPALDSLTLKLSDAKQRLASLQQQFAPQHPQVKRIMAEVEDLEQQIKQQINDHVKTTLIGLTNRLEVARAKAAILAQSGKGVAASDAARQQQKRLLQEELLRLTSKLRRDAASDDARQEQKRTLQEEIVLLTKKLDQQRSLVQVGRLTENELWSTEREILQLQRQMAALDSGSPATAEQRRLVEEQVKDVEVQLERLQEPGGAGDSYPPTRP
jgi:hypothetical protein